MLRKLIFSAAFAPGLLIAGQLMAIEDDSTNQSADEVTVPAPDVAEAEDVAESENDAVSEAFDAASEPSSADEVQPPQELIAPDSASTTSSDVEVIHERYPNRAVKIERHVTQDAAGNYYNHGQWTHWDEAGNVLAQGEFREGKRHGKWTRWYGPKDGQIFVDAAVKGFERPFGTEVTFANGQMDGIWKVFDAKGREVCHWKFEKGQRQGLSVWYLPTGEISQQVNFKNGQMDGDLQQLGKDRKLVVAQRYVDGHRIGLDVQYYSPGKKKSVGGMLYALTYQDATYDWWTGTVNVVAAPKEMKDERHGKWVRWFANGQKQFEGEFKNDQPVDKFTWWHSNGQVALQGQYADGLEQGKFVWWYPSGQKQVQGEYTANVPTGNWIRWTAEGKVVQSEDYRGKDGGVSLEKIVEESKENGGLRVGELAAPANKSAKSATKRR
jgi:antitoxin component YwqK of YwqJK toxin-antitoxin module